MPNSSQPDNNYYGLKSWEIIIISIFIILIIAAPWIFTQESFLGFDFEDTGQIGDTIGGITAPFINLLAAFLVYKSFSAQIRANKIQMDFIQKEQSTNNLMTLLTL